MVLRNNGKRPTNVAAKFAMFAVITCYTGWLKLVNLFSRRGIVGECDVDVSITTYGDRTKRVWRTIETIGAGTARPHAIFLWLEDERLVTEPPRALRRLMRRGLTLKHCPDYGPHKKYFPYVISQAELTRSLVTADDDVLYPSGWLAGLINARRFGEVLTYRAREILDGPYASWPLCTSTTPSEDLMATGVSGVLYPPEVLQALRKQGDGFMQICPFADDFWLHYAAVASGIPTRQVRETAANWWPTAPWQDDGLENRNVLGGGNDAISKATKYAWLGERDQRR